MGRNQDRGEPYRVQVVAEENQEYFRDTVLGVRRYGFSTGRMVFADRWLDHDLSGDLRELVRRDGVRGIVTALHSVEAERRFACLGIPVVNVSNAIPSPKLPLVTQNDEAVGLLAAEHLRACGCRALGFWGGGVGAYSVERLAGFRRGAREAGLSLSVGGNAAWSPSPAHTFASIKFWLAGQPRPLGVFAVLDAYALQIMRAARELGWRVPEDVAVLGAGDEDFLVEFESVPLSSVRLPARQIGHEAAVMLDRLIRTGKRTARAVRLPGARIVARRSTDVLYAGDEVVARGVRHIREHALENPYVADVARAAGVSTVALQSRFREQIGRTVLAEITRVRVSRAQELLTGTSLKMEAIAERCGFPNSQRFSVVFRQVAGVSPGGYRRQFREA